MTVRRIERLPEHVANQIAAGEVVARPASVVKELVENALDAGASKVVVSIEGGGIGLVRVVDDGSGMDRADARTALERHATSKLRSADDLATLSTLGFRGEALPSIASVSRFTMRTRTAREDEGTELVTDANGAPTLRPCGTAVGTTIEVRELFFNVPARRKFLRSLATEAAHIGEALRDTALAHPQVQFELWRDGRRHRLWLRVNTLAERARELFSGEAPLDVSTHRGPLTLEGYLSRPDRVRSGAGGLTLLVNRRPVQDRAIARAVAAAYGDRIERGKFPLGVVSIELPASECDVNVHPQKAEVRFAEPRAVCDAVFAAVELTLGRDRDHERPSTNAPRPDSATRGWREPMRAPTRAPEGTPWTWVPSSRSDSVSPRLVTPPSPRADEATPVESVRPAVAVAAEQDVRLVANWRGVALVEDRRGLYFVDVVAAATTILIRRALGELETGRLGSRPLLFPLRIEATNAASAQLDSSHSSLETLGFELRTVAPRTLALHAIPSCFAEASADVLGRLVLERLGKLDTLEGKRDLIARASRAAAEGASPSGGSPASLLEQWYRTLDPPDDLRDRPEVRHFVPASAYRSKESAP